MNDNLTPKKRKAVEALLTCIDIASAARQAGVSRETMYRWMKEPAFRAALNDASLQALEGLSRTLVNLGEAAARVLQETLDDQTSPAGVRVRAADIVLSRILQLRELVDWDQRLKALERSMTNGTEKTD